MGKYSPQKSDWVAGKLSNDFPNEDLRKLKAITDAALNYGLIFDSDARLGRLDSADVRTDSTDTGSTSKKKPAPSSLQQKRLDAEEAIKQQYKNPRVMPHERLKKADSKPAMPPQGPDTRTADEAKAEMEQSILNQHKGVK